ncbi:hypothetical protein WG29040_23290 [Pseudomonas sp. PAMC 29040]|uniref:hypothetical protein n=1 Tax=Pseudomonas sp. PAMC 29040 TaxID=2498450 RepID=UPI000FAF9B7F|nr:hypothetical protein [Pseudomonas sp. PAMC 29040]RUT30866.1 hypothetical protein WG29040_23290 [Pseudomonas sp. PAMC 29040]
MSAVKRFSIAQLRFAGGKEHDVNYVSVVHYDAAVAREAQLRVDRDDDANTFNLELEKLQRSEAALRLELGRTIESKEHRMAENAALRESLSDKREEFNKLGDRYDALQQRQTSVDQRVNELEGLLRECQPALEKAGYSTWQIDDALKLPAPLALPVQAEGAVDE